MESTFSEYVVGWWNKILPLSHCRALIVICSVMWAFYSVLSKCFVICYVKCLFILSHRELLLGFLSTNSGGDVAKKMDVTGTVLFVGLFVGWIAMRCLPFMRVHQIEQPIFVA